LIRMNLSNREALVKVLSAECVQTVVYAAGVHSVGESFQQPELYYERNTGDVERLLDACAQIGIQRMVFASSSLVYSPGKTKQCSRLGLCESETGVPSSPYGDSKLQAEILIKKAAQSNGLNYAILRYFNVAGAHPRGHLGRGELSTAHVVKVLCQVALGKRARFEIFGGKFATPDGTAIRDYVHVLDVARANRLAVEALQCNHKMFSTLNIGSGTGLSTLQIVNLAERVFQKEIPISLAEAVHATEPCLIANIIHAYELIRWKPQFSTEDILAHAWRWENFLSGQNSHRETLLEPGL